MTDLSQLEAVSVPPSAHDARGGETAIRLSQVSKTYPMFRSPIDRLKRSLGLSRASAPASFNALQDINLTIRRGETVGILGVNGAGKSTLLGIIAAVIAPSSGTVEVKGRITALLELGAGFNPDWSGRQNAEFFGILNGMTSVEARAQLPEIEAFADIGSHFDQPMRTYSSGMFMRVAFAAAICVNPDVLIVDEALAVGDARFQNKCFRKFDAFKKSGKTILFVTHSPDLVAQHCNRCIVMNAGSVFLDGEPEAGVTRYYDLLYGAQSVKLGDRLEEEESGMSSDGSDHPAMEGADESDAASMTVMIDRETGPFADLRARSFYNPNEEVFGRGGATVLDARLHQEGQVVEGVLDSRKPLRVQFAVRFDRYVPSPIFGVMLKNSENLTVYGLNSELAMVTHPPAHPRDVFVVELNFYLNVPAGEYFVDFGVALREENDEFSILCGRFSALHVIVRSKRRFVGLADLSGRIQAISLPHEERCWSSGGV